ncbi:molbdenum-transport integral membrane proteinABC transporter [Mycobacterium tuberculosis CAS/NITR204]|uniref:Molbdenum-transport integral membrane proteinABC transporter n=1 Tax=Mycobacterium tuberculosis CAS/NITR204 TaxID=1310114 RepID=R4MH87_MYCTX|nr:molbdenum-transport integral membrane proteinABC transporter [Mycobacterium tuberculosis CAS/NITR204]
MPLVAIAIRVDWPRFWALITTPSSQTALLLSVKTAAASTVLCVLLGVPMALVLARSRGRLVRSLRPLILLPLVLPPVVGGIALLYAFGRLGLIGRYLEFSRHQHPAGCGAGADLCLAAVSGDFPRGCSPHRRSRLRGGGGDTWGAARHCLVARDPAVAAPGRGVRISTGVCPLARRVWRDPNLCRFPARGHPYPSAGDLPAAGDRSGRGGGIVTAARCGSGTGGAGCGCSYADRDRYQVAGHEQAAAARGRRRPAFGRRILGVRGRGACSARAQRCGQVHRPACYRGAASPRRGLGTFGGPGVDRHRGRGECGDPRPSSRAAVARPVVVSTPERGQKRGLRTTMPSRDVWVRAR